MKRKAKEQKEFMDSLLEKDAECEVRVNVWHPKEDQLDWLLDLKQFKVAIHKEVPTILDFYDGHGTYDSPTELTVFLHDEDLPSLRKHEKLKHLYEEWYKVLDEQVAKKQGKGGDKK